MSAPRLADPAQRARWDSAVLALLKTGEPAAARTLHALCLAQAQDLGTPDGSAFWRQCAAFFELAALNPGLPGATVKRMVSRILLQYVLATRGQAGASQALLRELQQFCAAHDTFLEQADESSRRLEAELGAWARAPHQPVPAFSAQLARTLAEQARAVGFDALAGVARQLAQALARAEQGDPALAAQAGLLLAGAEHARQLLHQWAAGVAAPVNEPLRQALAALPGNDGA